MSVLLGMGDFSMSENSGHSFAAYFKRAVSPLVVLSMLRDREMYGYEISQEIDKFTDGKLAVALLYPVLYRLEEQGYIKITKTTVENGRARNYYTNTPAGDEYLDRVYAEYKVLAVHFARIVEER